MKICSYLPMIVTARISECESFPIIGFVVNKNAKGDCRIRDMSIEARADLSL